MADRGFTISDQFSLLGVTLNIPPFMEGQSQLPPDKDVGVKLLHFIKNTHRVGHGQNKKFHNIGRHFTTIYV